MGLLCIVKNLASITIGKSIRGIHNDALSDCAGLTSVIWNTNKYAWESGYNEPFTYRSVDSQIKSFTFGSEVNEISNI